MYHNCRICQKNVFKDIDTDIVNGIRLRYEICEECGLVQQNPLPSREFYHKLPCSFPKDYDNHAVRRASYILDFIKPYIPDTAKILDVGCGPGRVMEVMEQRGHDCYGFTLEGPVKNIKIQQADVETDKLTGNNFDVICLTHVVEHFLDPVNTLRRLRDMLSPNGIMYIEVPSFTWGEVRSKRIFTPEHVSYFTPETLQNLVTISGMSLVCVKESKYWGNIKMVCHTTPYYVQESLLSLDYREILRYSKSVRWKFPFYKLMRKLRKVGPNE